MLEKMSDFFETRLDGYDEHMLKNTLDLALLSSKPTRSSQLFMKPSRPVRW